LKIKEKNMLSIHTIFEGGTSVVRMNRERKLNMLGGSMATSLAKKQNDPLYAKLIKAKRKYQSYKDMIQQKYGRRGAVSARRSIS